MSFNERLPEYKELLELCRAGKLTVDEYSERMGQIVDRERDLVYNTLKAHISEAHQAANDDILELSQQFIFQMVLEMANDDVEAWYHRKKWSHAHGEYPRDPKKSFRYEAYQGLLFYIDAVLHHIEQDKMPASGLRTHLAMARDKSRDWYKKTWKEDVNDNERKD